MLSIIVPAHNERAYLSRTIDNILSTATGEVEIIVVDQGGNGDIDPRAIVIAPGENVGERRAMNLAAQAASGEFLLRIDAHCDFSPPGWDRMLMEVTGEKDLTMAVLTALRKPWDRLLKEEQAMWLATNRTHEDWDPVVGRAWPDLSKEEQRAWLEQKRTREDWHDWQRLKGHWYGLTRLIVSEHGGKKGFEAKWQGANKDHAHYHGVHPTMAATGCGMMIRKKFYDEIGGADESLPPMGAIGEEFAIKAWAHGGRCQVHTDTMIGHIFGTGGYPTEPVFVAQQMLYEKYQDVYPSLAEQFPTFEGLRLIKTDQPGPDVRTVIVERVDTHDTTHPQTGKLIRRRVERFRYVWLENEHPDEKHLSEKEIELKYAPRGTRIASEVFYVDEAGSMVPEIAPNEPQLIATP